MVDFAGSTKVGGANTTAVLDIVAVVDIPEAVTAPTGSRDAVGLAFCAGLRRIGAKAKLADHPMYHCWIVRGVFPLLNGR